MTEPGSENQIRTLYSVLFYSLSCLVAITNLAVYNVIPLIENKQARRYSRGDMVKLFIWTSLLLHGISAIYTSIKMTDELEPDTKASLLTSCFSSMVFNLLTIYLVCVKMSAIAPHEMYMNWLASVGVAGLKIPSFGLLIAVMIHPADYASMKLGRALTMGGNTVFVIYLLYSVVRYAQFLNGKLTKKDASVKLNKRLKIQFYFGFAIVTTLQLGSVLLMFDQVISAFESKIHHAIVIAIASFTTSVLVYFHTWLDDVFLFALGEIKSLKTPTVRKRDQQVSKKQLSSSLGSKAGFKTASKAVAGS